MSTAAQIAANQANAQLSTGPTSEAGKSRSSLNAVKTGLTGHTVLLPGDDVARYNALIAGYMQDYKPVGEQELGVVQLLADTQWRIFRIPSLESAIFALGHIANKDQFSEEPDPAVRHQLIQAKIYLDYGRQIDRLMTQEARLHRQQEKNRARLLELQAERARQLSCRLTAAAQDYLKAVEAGKKAEFIASTKTIGFEFSLPQIEARAASLRPAHERPSGQSSSMARFDKYNAA